jgi:hypothetical protein
VDKYEQLNENNEQNEKKYNSFREEPERKYYNNANKYWRVNKQTKAVKENEQFESFFSKMGNKVIINKLNNEYEKNPLYNSENTSPRKSYKKIYFY